MVSTTCIGSLMISLSILNSFENVLYTFSILEKALGWWFEFII
jgi:hypothetical protein